MSGFSAFARQMSRCGFALLIVTSVASRAWGAETKPKPSLDEALIQARSALLMGDRGLAGDGAAILEKALAESRYVLLGEDHLSREIPRFTAGICDLMKPDAYAVEAGPEAARFVTGVLSSAQRRQRMAERMRAHPNNMAFLDGIEENDAAAHCATTSANPHFAIWGLDQEFIGSAGTLLEAMQAGKPGPKARAAIADALKSEQRKHAAALESGDPGQLFLLSASEADLEPLAAAVAIDGKAATRSLLEELLASHAIYRLNAEGSPDSNRVRAELFKQHFLTEIARIRKSIAEPRVLFKFGDNHSGKGFSPLQVRDIGNFVAEFADGEKTRSLHIMVFGARGKHGAFEGYAKPLKAETFSIADYPEYRWIEPAVARMLSQPETTQGVTLTMYDLRTLRFRGIDMPPDWKRIVFSYDLLVLMPELSSASLIQ